MDAWIPTLLHWLALPEFGLSSVFLIALLSATLLPMGSEPAVVGLLQLRPDLFWPTVLVATAGNTAGGAISWWMGRAAQRTWQRARRQEWVSAGATAEAPAPRHEMSRAQRRARIWLRRWGAKSCLFSWLPVVGDPLCAVAGWLHLPFWPCVAYMAVGKFLRYVLMTSGILWLLPLVL